jgi:hypothetical protein
MLRNLKSKLEGQSKEVANSNAVSMDNLIDLDIKA